MSNTFFRRDFYAHNVIIILALCGIYLNSIPITTADNAVWLRLGDLFWENLSVIRHDPFSFLETKEMIYPAWGAGALYSLINKVAGLEGIELFHKFYHLFFLFLMTFLNRDFFSKKFNFPTLLITLLSIYLGTFFINRPAGLVSIPFLLITYLCFSSKSSFFKRYFLALVLGIIWNNIHGSAILFPLIIGLGLVLDYYRKTISILKMISLAIIPFALLFINPFGSKLFPYILETARISRSRGITEWDGILTLNYVEQSAGIIFLIILLILAIKRRAIKNGFVPMLVSMITLSLTGIRHSVWPSWMSLLTLKNKNEREFNLSKISPFVCGFLVILFILTLVPSIQKKIAGDDYMKYNKYSPANVIQYIDNKGNIFNEFEFGSFLIYSLPNKIFIDTRNIIYAEKQFKEYKDVMLAKDNWQEILQQYNVEWLLVGADRKPIIEAISLQSSWKVIFRDKNYFLAKKL
ncbi:MAG: hypothetical protein GY909_01010 [Oligoflexia bacterium]|nr:hypothetical protein [Oligoflexia bacterium]